MDMKSYSLTESWTIIGRQAKLPARPCRAWTLTIFRGQFSLFIDSWGKEYLKWLILFYDALF